MINNKYATIINQKNIKDIKNISLNYLVADAVFSDETKNFVIPNEPTDNEPVTVFLRTIIDNIDKAYINFDENILETTKDRDEGLFSFYSYTFSSIPATISYYFSILKEGIIYYYNKKGISETLDTHYNFKIIPNFRVPKWAKGAVMYQIYVDRFNNGDISNDVINNEYVYLNKLARGIKNWEQPVQENDFCNFYGGDLQGIIDKILYLKDLGIEAIYLSPAFVSPSSHKYDIQDYDYIDPHFGVVINDTSKTIPLSKKENKYASMYIKRTTNKQNLEASNNLMINLIEIAHSHGIKVIIDGVFNHCGGFHKWLNKEDIYETKGAYQDKNSPYVEYFKWNKDSWPNNSYYEGWWGLLNHPKLNYEASQELYNYIIEIGAKWVSPPFNADGWRLDVAADLGFSKEFNHKFWRDFRKSVKNANPNAIILAEHYGDYSDWLQGDQWDTVMNYDAFMEPITWFLTGMDKHSEKFNHHTLCNSMDFESSMRFNMSRLTIQSLLTSMNQLSNHDHSRFLTRTNMTPGRLHTLGYKAANENINKSIMYEAVVFQMTWPGAPTIYYGDEAGLAGWTDPDNRRTYPWGKEDNNIINFHKEIIKIRKKYSSIKTGSLEYLYNDYGVISYGRWDKNNAIAVALNNNDIVKELNLPIWKIGVNLNDSLSLLISTQNNSYSIDKKIYNIKQGFLKIILPPYSSVVLGNEI